MHDTFLNIEYSFNHFLVSIKFYAQVRVHTKSPYIAANAIMQSTAVIIEKTATTLVSDQPHNSK